MLSDEIKLRRGSIEIYEIGDPENCSGCQQIAYLLEDISTRQGVSFELIPYSFVHKNSTKNIKKIMRLYGKLPKSIPVVIIKNRRGIHVFNSDTGFGGIEEEC